MQKDNKENIKNVAVLAGIALGGYFLFKISKGNSVTTSIKQTVEKPAEIIKDVADEVVKVGKKGLKYLTKGSQEAKDYMAKLRSGKKKSNSMSKSEYKKNYKKEKWKIW